MNGCLVDIMHKIMPTSNKISADNFGHGRSASKNAYNLYLSK
ncbi:hypothetical protein [Clostridium omnivorum]|uniref:Uncharacterized protein n=1 Tax=Clostridium omnivorum TaxID=1604902 RepID=A0ABQ5N1M0_9CLOT|nr:hypothetical protein [Clostridium sp. E14]GLC29093.1 hypothetical protein bsdE14_05030 [Clostridium sp. E14]